MIINNKRISMGLLGVATATMPVAFIVSCNDDTKEYRVKEHFNGFSELIANYKNQNVLIEAKITKWVDGDTVKINYIEVEGENKGKWTTTPTSVRISSIDTPESHVVDASTPTGDLTEKELKWGVAAGEWARKEVPVGSTIKLWTNFNRSYDRIVGSIFYTKDDTKPYNENFSVNLVKAGLSLPRVDGGDGAIFGASRSDIDVLHYLAIPLYQAWTEAKDNKIGLYEFDEEEINLIYKKHGAPANALTFMPEYIKYRNGRDGFYADGESKSWFDNETFSIYNIYTKE